MHRLYVDFRALKIASLVAYSICISNTKTNGSIVMCKVILGFDRSANVRRHFAGMIFGLSQMTAAFRFADNTDITS